MGKGGDLAMATMDLIKQAGGSPSIFLTLVVQRMQKKLKGFRIILKDPSVKAILINIFGGIVRCDGLLMGLWRLIKISNINIPIIVQAGTNSDIAKK